MKTKDKATIIIKKLCKEYPAAKIELRHANPWELLVATILSASARING